MTGKTHSVFTGVCLIGSNPEEEQLFHVETTVEFGEFPDSFLEAYVKTGEPMYVFLKRYCKYKLL